MTFNPRSTTLPACWRCGCNNLERVTYRLPKQFRCQRCGTLYEEHQPPPMIPDLKDAMLKAISLAESDNQVRVQWEMTRTAFGKLIRDKEDDCRKFYGVPVIIVPGKESRWRLRTNLGPLDWQYG